MKRISLEPAHVLHRRAYRETSFLVDVFTRDHGRLTLLARGVRKQNSASQGLLQPFTPLLVSWSGRGELMTLTEVELNGDPYRLQGECLFAGFYLNELMMALLHKWDPHPNLFLMYGNTIKSLQEQTLQEKYLRAFEKFLLEELGYGVLPKSKSQLLATFSAEKYYRFIPEHGFTVTEIADVSQVRTNIFSGNSLIAIAQEKWDQDDALSAAKRLMRYVLAPLLGAKQIYSRQLFAKIEPELALGS